MNLLPEAFVTASVAGLWLPLHWQSSRLRMLYRAYTCFTVAVMLLIIASQLVALIFLTRSVDELVEAAYLFLTAANACVKSLNMLMRRGRIVDLLDMFADWKCAPANAEEWKLCWYFNKVARYMVLSYMGMGLFSTSFLSISPLFFIGDNYILSMRAWQPYEISGPITYSITQIHQMLALMTTLFWNGSSDVMCPAFMIQICSQLRLMCQRMRDLPDDVARQRRLVRQSVQHHLHIFELKRRLETAFAPAILSQYLLSSLVLCISIYQLATKQSDIVQALSTFMYVSGMAVELLAYCWFANDVSVTSLKFSEMVCQADWTKLHASNRKGLLIMMLRSSLPMRITCGPFITLSNDAFTGILKLSYSVFNVLQQSR